MPNRQVDQNGLYSLVFKVFCVVDLISTFLISGALQWLKVQPGEGVNMDELSPSHLKYFNTIRGAKLQMGVIVFNFLQQILAISFFIQIFPTKGVHFREETGKFKKFVYIRHFVLSNNHTTPHEIIPSTRVAMTVKDKETDENRFNIRLRQKTRNTHPGNTCAWYGICILTFLSFVLTIIFPDQNLEQLAFKG